MYWKWYESGALPALRVDRWPSLVRAGALAVVALELSFPLLALLPRTRLLATGGGLVFHGLSKLFLFIPFMSLWGCYTALVDWGWLWARIGKSRPRAAGVGSADASLSARRALPAALVGGLLVVLAVTQGARNAMQAWPFACYPTFQWTVGSE